VNQTLLFSDVQLPSNNSYMHQHCTNDNMNGGLQKIWKLLGSEWILVQKMYFKKSIIIYQNCKWRKLSVKYLISEATVSYGLKYLE